MEDSKEAQKKEMGQEDDSVKKQLSLKTSKNRYTVKKGTTVKIKAFSSNGRKVTFKSNKRKIASVDYRKSKRIEERYGKNYGSMCFCKKDSLSDSKVGIKG